MKLFEIMFWSLAVIAVVFLGGALGLIGVGLANGVLGL